MTGLSIDIAANMELRVTDINIESRIATADAIGAKFARLDVASEPD